jgi:leader peptidase (prepilin peptidase)/N-methyltransferase
MAVVMVSFSVLPLGAAIASCLLGLAMLGIVLADSRWFIVPDALSLPAIVAGLLASGRLLDPASDALTSGHHVIGMIAGGLGFWLIRVAYAWLRGQEGLGLGDVKLAAAAGAWVGWQELANVVLLASSLALAAITLVSLARGRPVSATDKLPFGCFLAPSVWLVWLLGVYSRTS